MNARLWMGPRNANYQCRFRMFVAGSVWGRRSESTVISTRSDWPNSVRDPHSLTDTKRHSFACASAYSYLSEPGR